MQGILRELGSGIVIGGGKLVDKLTEVVVSAAVTTAWVGVVDTGALGCLPHARYLHLGGGIHHPMACGIPALGGQIAPQRGITGNVDWAVHLGRPQYPQSVAYGKVTIVGKASRAQHRERPARHQGGLTRQVAADRHIGGVIPGANAGKCVGKQHALVGVVTANADRVLSGGAGCGTRAPRGGSHSWRIGVATKGVARERRRWGSRLRETLRRFSGATYGVGRVGQTVT